MRTEHSNNRGAWSGLHGPTGKKGPTPVNRLSPLTTTPAINTKFRISLQIFSKNSKRPQKNTVNCFIKNLNLKSHSRLPLTKNTADDFCKTCLKKLNWELYTVLGE